MCLGSQILHVLVGQSAKTCPSLSTVVAENAIALIRAMARLLAVKTVLILSIITVPVLLWPFNVQRLTALVCSMPAL
jgi:hypothetical protein